MEWILQIITKHTDKDGKVDTQAVDKEIRTEFAKNAVPKEDFNAKVAELKEANKTLAELKEKHADVETLQQTISDHETTIKELQDEKAASDKKYAVETALRDAGAMDIDYLAYKLGEVELDKEGNAKDLDSKIKDLQANNPTFFSTEPEDKGNEPPEGFKTIENKLNDGKASPKDATAQFIDAFTSDLQQTQEK